MTNSNRTEFSKALGLAHKFGVGWEEAGGSREELNALAENQSSLRDILAVLRGQAEVAVREHVIDCSAEPFIPDGWRLAEDKHQVPGRVIGKVTWDPSKVALHLDAGQEGDKAIEGHKLLKRLEGKPVLTAHVLDYLIDHPHLIPTSWKGKYTYFWGAVYCGEGGHLMVRYLYWFVGHWRWGNDWLSYGFDASDPAAVSASS